MRASRRVTPVTFAVAILLAAFVVVASPSGAAGAAQPSIDDQIAAADAKLKATQLKVGKAFARFTAAEKQQKTAVAAVKTARTKERRARAQAAAAAKVEQASRGRFDQFAGAGYREGQTVTSVEALLVSDNPSEMLQQARLLAVLSGEYADVLNKLTTSTAQKARAESDAQQAVKDAAVNRDKAATAKTAAKRTYTAAIKVQAAAAGKADRLAAQKASLIAQGGGGNGVVVRPTVGTFTSGFGARDGASHNGIDLANSIGTPILSAMAGEVIDAGPASGFGQWVRVQHAANLITVYGHVATFTVSVGDTVNAGDQIATMGNEGESTGPHLHFEVHQDGTPIDPLPWLNGFGVEV